MMKTKRLLVFITLLNVVLFTSCKKETETISPPMAPSSLIAKEYSGTQIFLSWIDNSDIEKGFKIERKENSDGAYHEIKMVDSNVTSYQDEGLNKNTQYFYRIRAYVEGKDSEYSNEASATTTDGTQGTVVTYSAPSGISLSTLYTVEVNGKAVDLYVGKVGEYKNDPNFYGGPYAFGNFDFSGNVTVKITTAKNLAKLKIQPQSLGIVPIVSGNTITFTLSKPTKLSVEPDGKNGPLLLFGNPLEVNPPKAGDPGVIYFGPGIHNPPNNVLDVKSNQTLYLAGGAVLRAGITVQGSNIKVLGRGIIDGNPWEHLAGPGARYPLFIKSCSNVTVEGITIAGAWGWTMPIGMSESVTVSNVKICGGRVWNDDGIDPCSSTKVTIQDCFIRTDDDCIAIKGFTWGAGNRNVDEIKIINCTLWCDRARIFVLGHESSANYMQNIEIRDINVLHYVLPPILIEPIENMTVQNVLFDNIHINGEGQTNEYIRIRSIANLFNNNSVCGYVKNITLTNVSLIGSPNAKVVVSGSSDHYVENVVFNHLTRNGSALIATSPGVTINSSTSNIKFNP